MEINFLILGSLFILTLFSVGESVYKNFKIDKKIILIVLLFLIVGIFLPPLQINEYTLYFDKHIFPFAISIVCLFKIKKFSRFMFAFLFSVLASMLYLLVTEEIVTSIVEPFVIFGVGLGFIIGMTSGAIAENLSSLFLGINAGSLLFYISKYESLETLFFEQSIFAIVLIAWITSSIILFFKNKLMMVSNNYSKEEYF